MKSSAPLTPRQYRMLDKLIDLYRRTGQPIHYPAIARALGVHNTAAYEMLRLLEQEGYVTTEYLLSANAGPGRSTVVFSPTRQAYALVRSSFEPSRDSKWEAAKKQILSRLGGGERGEKELLADVLSRLPNVEEPLVYCAQTFTALFLNLGHEARQRLQAQGDILHQLVAGPNTRNLLALLPGLALGLGLPDPAQRASEKLFEYSERCQTYLQQLDEAKQRALAEFVEQVLNALEIAGVESAEPRIATELNPD